MDYGIFYQDIHGLFQSKEPIESDTVLKGNMSLWMTSLHRNMNTFNAAYRGSLVAQTIGEQMFRISHQNSKEWPSKIKATIDHLYALEQKYHSNPTISSLAHKAIDEFNKLLPPLQDVSSSSSSDVLSQPKVEDSYEKFYKEVHNLFNYFNPSVKAEFLKNNMSSWMLNLHKTLTTQDSSYQGSVVYYAILDQMNKISDQDPSEWPTKITETIDKLTSLENKYRQKKPMIASLAHKSIEEFNKLLPSEGSSIDSPISSLSSNSSIPDSPSNSPASISTSLSIEEKNQERLEAAIMLQSIFRGQRAEKNIVYPDQIKHFIEQELRIKSFSSKELDLITKGICREINDLTKSPEQNKGKSIHIEQVNQKESWYIPSDREEAQWHKTIFSLKLPFDCWVEMAPDGQSVTLTIAPLREKYIGEGGYKHVFKAQQFTIFLKLSKEKIDTIQSDGAIDTIDRIQRKGESLEQVWTRPKPLAKASDIEANIAESSVQEEIIRAIGKPVNIANPSRSRIGEGSDPTIRIQQWYHGDLSKASKTMKIPEHLYSSNSVPITLANLVSMIDDVAEALDDIHSVGYIHRDVKPENILIDLPNTQGTPIGVLGDFGLASKAGVDNFPNYFYWPSIAGKGWVTNYSDLFGLAMATAEILLPHFTTSYDDRTKQKFMSGNRQEILIGELSGQICDLLDPNWTTLPSYQFDIIKRKSVNLVKALDANNPNRKPVSQNQKLSDSDKQLLIQIEQKLPFYNHVIDTILSVTAQDKVVSTYLTPYQPMIDEICKDIQLKEKDISNSKLLLERETSSFKDPARISSLQAKIEKYQKDLKELKERGSALVAQVQVGMPVPPIREFRAHLQGIKAIAAAAGW